MLKEVDMDISSIYIKMCSKAVEIQNLADTEGFRSMTYLGNVFCEKENNEYKFSSFYTYKHRDNIWLPRQDQLQEMVADRCNSIYSMIWAFAEYTDTKECPNQKLANYEVNRLFSMEQLWLAFVMCEKYDKVWSEEKQDWIKEVK